MPKKKKKVEVEAPEVPAEVAETPAEVVVAPEAPKWPVKYLGGKKYYRVTHYEHGDQVTRLEPA